MKKYEEYKNSGVDWFREIPKNWQLKRIDEVAKIVRGNTAFKKDELLDTGSYIALQYGKTYKVDEVNELFNFYVNDEFYKSNQIVRQGDTILISTSETIEDLGHTCFYNRTALGLLGGEQLMLRPNVNLVNPKFLYYFSKYYSNEIKKYATGLKVYRYNIDDLKNILVPVFSISEQQAIANYLDAKTSAIDKKVTLLEQKIETYKKLKRTLINQTITKGLRSLSEVEMKDSGISWIGQIPQHWEVKRLKDVVKIVNGYAFKSNDFSDDGLSVLRISDITKSDFSDLKKVPLFYKTLAKESKVLREDILMAMTGATIGKNSFFNGNDTLYLNQRVCSFRAINKNQLLPFYFSLFISSDFVQNLIKLIAGGSAQENISKSQLEVFEIVLPPKSEQEEIANYLDSKTATIDAIVGNITKQIETLKQLRKTLINDVVTGKIKVVN